MLNWPWSWRGIRDDAMKETERYIKVHSFLHKDLHLPEVMLKVFSLIFTLFTSEQKVTTWGTKYIAENTGLSIRSVKQALKCLLGAGLIVVDGLGPRGAHRYVPNISDCQTTSDARNQLMNRIHRCTSYTGEHGASSRCARCTFGGAYHALPIIKEKYVTKIQSKNAKSNNLIRRDTGEAKTGFKGSDTL